MSEMSPVYKGFVAYISVFFFPGKWLNRVGSYCASVWPTNAVCRDGRPARRKHERSGGAGGHPVSQLHGKGPMESGEFIYFQCHFDHLIESQRSDWLNN